MKFSRVSINNAKAISQADFENLGPIVVITGPNGSGKSTVLDAILAWASLGWRYRGGVYDPLPLIREGTAQIRVEIDVEHSQAESGFVHYTNQRTGWAPSFSELRYSLETFHGRSGSLSATLYDLEHRNSISVGPRNVRYRNPDEEPDVPIIDYYGPHRYIPTRRFTSFRSEGLETESEEQRRYTPSRDISAKVQYLKEYLWELDQRDWSSVKTLLDANQSVDRTNRPDHFGRFNEALSSVLPYFRFVGVESGPVSRFLFSTATGVRAELDDLSSGEKEVVSFVAELERTRPRNSVLLIDEMELHVNPAIESALFHLLAAVVRDGDNQVFLVTHSSAMVSMAFASGADVYRLSASGSIGNQAVRISSAEDLNATLTALVGDLSIFTTNDRFIFVEGRRERGSFDREVLSRLFPTVAARYAFVPAGGADSVQRAITQTQKVLESEIPYGAFYALIDRDRRTDEECQRLEGRVPRLRFWTRCMLENYLLVERAWELALTLLGVRDQSYRAGADFVRAAQDSRTNEISLRLDELIGGDLKQLDFRDVPNRTVLEKLNNAENRIATHKANLQTDRQAIENAVDAEIRDGSFRMKMHGKTLLDSYRKLVGVRTPEDQLMYMVSSIMAREGLVPDDMRDTIRRLIGE